MIETQNPFALTSFLKLRWKWFPVLGIYPALIQKKLPKNNWTSKGGIQIIEEKGFKEKKNEKFIIKI